MAAPVRIALDGYGGDAGLGSTVPGVRMALSADPDIEVLFVAGGEPVPGAGSRLLPVPSEGALPDGGHPAVALRSHPDLSIGLAARLAGRGEADALVSMGHTGATMIAARWFLKTFPGIDRTPAATTVPVPVGRPPVLVDLGANSTCSAQDLTGFAALGAAYAQAVLGRPEPRVALISNGTERGKGTPVLREAYDLLERSPLAFAGYIEPVDMLDGDIDVLVADGFLGNMLLKWMEGLSRLTLSHVRPLLDGTPAGAPVVASLERMTDVTRSENVVLLLGVRGVVVPGHGRAGPEDVARAVLGAADAVRAGLVPKVERVLDRVFTGKE